MGSATLWGPGDINASTKDLMARLCDVAREPRMSGFAAGSMTAIQGTQDSRLLSLSPELRNTIYEEVLVDTNDIDIPMDGKFSRPPLLKVCRQVAEEASTIFYGLNRFKSTNNRLGGLPLWFARLPLKLRHSINVIDLCYETETEMNNPTHERQTETAPGYGPSEQKLRDYAEERMQSANDKFLNVALQMALLGLDLNAFRLSPWRPISDSAYDTPQTDFAVLIRKARERIVSTRERMWIRAAKSTILIYCDEGDSRRFQQHRGDGKWLRKVGADNKAKDIMASLPEIISIIQG
ncbi:hypothetical protein KC361_g3037 [Hortaea werneckii]|nr:hypothetical protein KC361_g3037 [Hortaea werneckii]